MSRRTPAIRSPGCVMYRAYGLLKSGSEFKLDEAAARLSAQFPGSSVNRTGGLITLTKGDWVMNVALVAGPQVVTEVEGFVGKIAGMEPTEAEELIASGQRVEVWTDDPDPAMEHFNDYLAVVKVLKSFPGVVAVDPKEPALI